MATAPIDEEQRHGIGGNNPPVSIKERALVDASAALKPLLDRANELLTSASKAHASDAEAAGKCADLVKMIRACDTEIDAKRKEVQKPYDEAAKVIMDIPRKAKLDLASAKRDLTDIISAFDKKERERLKKEADEQAARDAADAESLKSRAESMGVELPAEEPKPEPARAKPVNTVQSDIGSSAYTRKVAIYTITDPYALPLAVLNHEKVQDAIKSVAREMLRADPEAKIKGILVTEDEMTVVR